MNKIKELEKRERDIRIEINELKYKEQIEKHVPFIKSFKGQCYKYRNSYGGNNPRWWSYKKILDWVEDKYGDIKLIEENFDIDCFGNVKASVGSLYVYLDGREPVDYWTKISQKEYETARKKFWEEYSDYQKLRKILETNK